MSKGWHIFKDPAGVTISRHLPVRFDVSAQTQLAGGDMLRLAMQIRQDMWRALQNVRGFSPVVQITAMEGRLEVKAGGRVMGPVARIVKEDLQNVLCDVENRSRWMRCAGFVSRKERL